MGLKILSLDFESSYTTPVNPRICRIFEIGAVLFSWEDKQPVAFMSNFIHEADHPMSPKELTDLTGITDEMKATWGIPLKRGIDDLNTLIEASDYVIAHNGNEFDKPLLYAEAERAGVEIKEKVWMDSKVDIEYPPKVQSRKLSYLCSEHLFINPFSHRAVFDALSVIEILKRYNIDEVIQSAKEPNCKLIASVEYNNRHLAKDRGYYWNNDLKHWWKSSKVNKAQAEKEAAPFPVRIIEC